MRIALTIAALLGGLGLAPGPGLARDLPTVASIDYCADQYILKLADRDQILAVSFGADDDYSYMQDAAQGLARVRDAAEDVLALKPDLVVRNWGGGPRALAYYGRLGIPVVNVDFVSDFDGIRSNILKIANALGQPERGAAVAQAFDDRRRRIATALAAMKTAPRPALYVTPSSVTSGSGTMVHEILTAAGLDNLGARNGKTSWYALPLEVLLQTPPDFIAASFFNVGTTRVDNWSLARHPVMQRLLERAQTVYLPGKLMACPAWYVMDAVEALYTAAYPEQPALTAPSDGS